MRAYECEAISERLVDYADRALTGDEASAVESHIAACEPCRLKLDALRRSLAAARSIWREAEAGLGEAGEPTGARPTVRRLPWMRRRASLAAAAVVLMFGGSVALHFSRPPSAPPKSAPPLELSFAEIERAIQLAALPVQMLGAADYLAEQPGGQDIACARYEYIAAAYPNSDAASQSLQRRQELCPDGDD